MTAGGFERRSVINAEKGRSRALAIFQITLIVGVLLPSSIWLNIARLTPDARDNRSSESPRFLRSRRRLEPTTGVRSGDALDEATSSALGNGKARVTRWPALRGPLVPANARPCPWSCVLSNEIDTTSRVGRRMGSAFATYRAHPDLPI